MHLIARRTLFLNITLLFMFPLPALAIPTITCHCFKDRSFEPARPAAADPYLLAATQNSFFALVFNVDKKTIVMKKQQGTSPDDLWIAYWIASKTAITPDALLQVKQKNMEWNDVLISLGLNPISLGSRFSSNLNSQSSPVRLAESVVEELFFSYKLMGDTELAAMRQAGASNQELIISTVIATKMRQPVRQIYLDVKKGAKTWGAYLATAKVDTKNLQQELSSVLKLQPQ